MEFYSKKLEFSIGWDVFKTRLYIVDLIAYNIILGKSWLTEVNSIIDWKYNLMRMNVSQNILNLDAKA